MNEHSETTAKHFAEASALAVEAAVPPLRPSPMPIQIIEFWTPRLMVSALLGWVGRSLRRAFRSAAFSAADSHEPR